MELFGRQERKTLGQVESHLVPKHTERAGSRAVFFGGTRIKDVLQ